MFLSIIVKLYDNMYKGLEVRNLHQFKINITWTFQIHFFGFCGFATPLKVEKRARSFGAMECLIFLDGLSRLHEGMDEDRWGR